MYIIVSCNGENSLFDAHAVSVLPNLSTKVSEQRRNDSTKRKKWFKPKFKEGGPPCLKGLTRTLHTYPLEQFSLYLCIPTFAL